MTLSHNCDALNEDIRSEVHLRQSWYEYHRFSNRGVLSELVKTVVQAADEMVSAVGGRKRRMKPDDRLGFINSIDSIVSNLAYISLQYACPRSIIVSRNLGASREHTNRYLPVKTFIKCFGILERCGVLRQSIGSYRGQRSTVIATALFHSTIKGLDLSFRCFRDCDSRPLVVLRRSIKSKPGNERRREPVSLEGIPAVDSLSDRIERINAFIKSGSIAFHQDGFIPVVDTTSRTLVRYFTILDKQEIRFDQAGRLFGPAFWLTLKSDRRGNIRIDGEPVADLDFKNLGPRLAYALIGHEAPGDDEDLYDLSGLLRGYEHDRHRKAIKQALASLLNGGKAGSRDILDELPEGTTAQAVREAIWTKHPALEVLCDGRPVPIGFTVMFIESRILLCALEKLMALGVVALPFHDGLMCARSKQRIAQEALRAASEEVVGSKVACGPQSRLWAA